MEQRFPQLSAGLADQFPLANGRELLDRGFQARGLRPICT